MGRYAEGLSMDLFAGISAILKKSDFVIANLESPLLVNGEQAQGKCTLRGSPDWAEVIKKAGVNLVSLANNHMADYGIEGLLSTIKALEKADLYYVGAGKDKKEACAPIFFDVAGYRIAFLARTSVIVASPSYAGEIQPGVAFLDVEETNKNINACKQQADIVILLIHWGLEAYYYPSHHQRLLARKLTEAGADLIIGHHPHVLQGVECIGSSLVAYSLGNFVFDDIQWSFLDKEGQRQYRIEKLTEENRKGGILRVTLSDKKVESYDLLPTYIHSDGKVVQDNSLERQRQFDRLSSRLQSPAYSLFWRAYSIRQEWLLRFKPLFKGKFSWSELKKLRYKHFSQVLHTIWLSAKIAAEKSTNPYE